MSEDSDPNDDEINNIDLISIETIDSIDSFVISPNMKHIVTHHTNNSLTIWDVDIDAKTVNIVKLEEDKKFYKVIGISNDRLIIYLCSDDRRYYIRNIETSEDISIFLKPHFSHLFLLNGDIFSWYPFAKFEISKAFLKSSKIYSSYNRVCAGGLEVLQVQKNEIIFVQNDYVLYQLNTKTMKIDNCYEIPNCNLEIDYSEKVEIAVNEEGSLFAVYCKGYVFVFSMMNGILISSRKLKGFYNDPKIQFLNIKDTEILMLHINKDSKILYMIMSPYDLSYIYEGVKETTHEITNYMIIETLKSSQILIMLFTGNQIKFIDDIDDFNIPVEKLNDHLKHDRNLFLYSSFSEIKDIIRNLREGQIHKKLHCEWKILRWELDKGYNYTLKVYKIGQNKDQKGDTLKIFHYNLEHLQILNNDDVLIGGDCIFVFSINETTNKIFIRYFYQNIDTFLESKILPNPTFIILKIGRSQSEDVIYELLSSRKYLAEMTGEIIDVIIKLKKDIAFNKLIESLTKDIAMNYRICDIITKYLPYLKLNYPIIYSKFISVTSLIPNSFISKPESYNEKKLVGYSCEYHDLEVFSYRESFIIELFRIIRNFQMFLYEAFTMKDQIGITFINFVVPYAGFTKYPPDYSYWKELIRPKSSPFVTLVDQTFCESWNAEAIITFKWKIFGRLYYYLFWGFFTMYLLTFGIGSTLPSPIITDDTRTAYLSISICLGLLLIVHEIRQFIWNPIKYIKDVWNWF
ncbi:20533_t:CDS:2, partial [Funneliformis geosporum]